MERQVAVGRVFGRGFAAMAANPLPIFLFAVTFGALPTLGVNYALAEFDRAAGPEPGWLPMLGALALGSMLWSVASSLTQGVLTRAVTAHAAGRRAGVGECLLAAVRVAPALLVLSVLMTVAIAAAAALFVVPGILLLLTWFVAVPALVEERSGVASALHRSSDLTAGARWSIFGLFLVLMAVGVVASVGTEVITGQWENADMAAVLRDPTYVILTTVSETFQAAFSATVVASLYVELRQWKEGDSVESLEQVFA